MLRSYAELSRISNAPTCVTNVLVGMAAATAIGGAGGAGDGGAGGTAMDWPVATLTAAGVVLLYVAGMALNDLIDVEVDRIERPGRPLPSGRISIAAARSFTAFCLGAGWCLLAIQGWPVLRLATALVIVIVLYDLLHRASAATVLLMGGCRGLVYLVAAAAIAEAAWPLTLPVVLWPAAAMSVYIVALSVVARREMAATPARRVWPTLVLPVIALTPALGVRPESWMLPAIAATLVVGWLALASARLRSDPPRVGAAVGGWLAGICLVDAFWLTLLEEPAAAAVAVACFLLTLVGHRLVAGT